jgi:hypothetical protein
MENSGKQNPNMGFKSPPEHEFPILPFRSCQEKVGPGRAACCQRLVGGPEY